MYELEPGDEGYADGARFRLDQIDGGQYAFPRRRDAEMFLAMHGMIRVNEKDMAKIRQNRKRGGRNG